MPIKYICDKCKEEVTPEELYEMELLFIPSHNNAEGRINYESEERKTIGVFCHNCCDEIEEIIRKRAG